MDLALAGLISGAGKGLMNAGTTGAQFGISAFLQDERLKAEAERDRRHLEALQVMQTEKIGAERELQQEKIGADIVGRTQEQAGLERRHGETQATAREELGMRRSFYESRTKAQERLEEIQKKRLELEQANKGKRGGTSRDVQLHHDYLKGFNDTNKRLDDPTISEERRMELEDDLDFFRRMIRTTAGGPAQSTRKTDKIEDDPFADQARRLRGATR